MFILQCSIMLKGVIDLNSNTYLVLFVREIKSKVCLTTSCQEVLIFLIYFINKKQQCCRTNT